MYCTITAYNTGLGGLLKSIPNKKVDENNIYKIKDEAIIQINNMSVKELYKHLTTSKKLSEEAKNYLPKVLKNIDKFKKILKFTSN